MDGLALARSEVPTLLFDRHQLGERVYDRGGEGEVRFLWRARPAVLPVWRSGRLELLTWGCRDRRATLPLGGWTWEETVQSGGWANANVQLADVPATFVRAGGVWTRVRHGVRSLVVPTPGGLVAYVVCRPATRYYRIMTGTVFQPVLIGEVI